MTPAWPPSISRRNEILLVSAIVLMALMLRTVAQWYAPLGWRDDELSSALVVTGHVLDGDFRIYYPDASGHEGLYEYFQAATMLLFGPTPFGIRGPSILFGTLAVLLTYLLARRLFDWPTAAIAALLLAVSFWSLMYSRTGQRHISATITSLLSFYFLWRASSPSDATPRWRDFVVAGVCMGLGFYTYFAARGLPLIAAAWGVYLLIWKREWFRRVWRGLALTLLIAVALAVPLILVLQQQPEAETRVAEVAIPLRDAQSGNYATIMQYTVTTLSMFTHDGDEEWLYNVPHRPVFGWLGGILFWAGMLLALIWAFGPKREPRSAFLLLWLGAGIAPGALSVPAASLGHTILAQPVAMIFPALAVTALARWLLAPPRFSVPLRTVAVIVITVSFLGWEAIRGPYDYWMIWPHDSFNRVLHHSDLHQASAWMNEHAETRNVAIGGFLLERWDQQAVKIDLEGDDWRVRAFDPRSASLRIPDGGLAAIPDYLVASWGVEQLGTPLAIDAPYQIRPIPITEEVRPESSLARFDNGLVLDSYELDTAPDSIVVITQWRVEDPLDLPPFPLLSKPPAPGEDDTPRLAIFLQLLDESGARVAGADGLGVDPYTLYPGDMFLQRLDIALGSVPPATYQLVIGLYNPATSQRRLDTLSHQDVVFLQRLIIVDG